MSAQITGIVGYPQTLTLSCESRSAVDVAKYFGITISELDFLYGLPTSDNPEKGFVGYANDALGQVPPASYGVHPPPVAALLRAYGLPAEDHKDLLFENIQDEIAAGHPVIAWVIYGLGATYPQQYTDSNGETVIVAPFEHTVIVVGYDKESVTVLDNQWRYSVSIDTFLRSWNTLGRLAITFQAVNATE